MTPEPINPMPLKANLLGWFALVLVTLASSFWSFWGVIEAFHEGWCKPTLGMRLGQTLIYLAPAIVLSCLAVVSIRWPRVGAALLFLVGIVIAVLVCTSNANFSILILTTIIAIPIFVGILFLMGRPRPSVAAYVVAFGIPFLILIIAGAEPAIRVSQRVDDGDRRTRLIEGNGISLVWAPAGPGWTRDGNITWEHALDVARHLSADGLEVMDEPQNIWRLPTREEVVRTLTRTNLNSGGVWDATNQVASYERKPDKESPIWDSHAPLIYLWTSEEHGEDRAWIVVYHGGVFSKPKNLGATSAGLRAVRSAVDH